MREIVLLPWSLRLPESAAQHWLNAVNPAEDCLLLFWDFAQYCEASNLTASYHAILSGLNRRGIRTRILDCDGLEQFLLTHNSATPIYTTPLTNTECVVTAAAACSYTGQIFCLGANAMDPPLRNLTAQIRSFSATPRAGTRGLNRAAVLHAHPEGSLCHYTIQDKRVEQRLGSSALVGTEGHVIPSQLEGFCLKIWDIPRFQYANEKISVMLHLDDNPELALPLAFVFNEQNEPIGIVMRFFDGKTTTLDQLYRFPNPLKLCRDILRQLIWLEARTFLHCDLWHNIKVDAAGAHLLDLDSVQFAGYPATAESQDAMNYLPARFSRAAAFGSSINTAYTTLKMLILLYVDTAQYNRLLWDERRQCDTIQPDILRSLPPKLQAMVLDAHRDECPVSLVRQLRFVEEEMAHASAAPNMEEEFPEFVTPCTEETDTAWDTPLREQTPARPAESPRRSAPYQRQTQKAAVRTKKSWLVRQLQRLLISLFGCSSGTIPHTYGSPVDPWDIFVQSKLWRKPLIITVVILMIILAVVIAILSL